MMEYSDGVLRLQVPERWQAVAGTSPGKVHVYKDLEAPEQVFSRAGITVCVHPNKNWYHSSRGFYDNVVDIAPLEIGTRNWQGYNCTSLGYPYTMLETEDGAAMLQVMVLLRNGEYAISMEDPDVLAVIANLEILR